MTQPDDVDSGYGAEHRGGTLLHDWRLKVAVQALLSRLPLGARLNYALQRHITRTLPVSDSELAAQVTKAQRHVSQFQRYSQRPLASAHLFEFGAGWDLVLPIVYYAMGAERQTVIDIRPLARLDLVMDAARRIGARSKDFGLQRVPGVKNGAASVRELGALWGIEYRAPADARNVSLDDGSVDLITSTDVLEHVPPMDIALILRECRRLLHVDGLMSVRIDYQDHYWYFDRRVDPYHFLRFTDSKWKRFNPDLHYQNRLRHQEYLELFRDAGFAIRQDDRHMPNDQDLARVAATPLAPRFREMSVEDVAVRYANITLVPSASGIRSAAVDG